MRTTICCTSPTCDQGQFKQDLDEGMTAGTPERISCTFSDLVKWRVSSRKIKIWFALPPTSDSRDLGTMANMPSRQ